MIETMIEAAGLIAATTILTGLLGLIVWTFYGKWNYLTTTIAGMFAVAIIMQLVGGNFKAPKTAIGGGCKAGCWRVQDGQQVAIDALNPSKNPRLKTAMNDQLLINGYPIRLDPDSEQFRAKLMGQ